MGNHHKMHDLTLFSKFQDSENVITYRIIIARNLAGYNFLPLMRLESIISN